MKIPFDIKFRPQIESGEYKVETRDRRPARIICWDRIVTEPFDNCNIVALVTETKFKYESTHFYYQDGHLWNKANDEGDSPSDLFIITPEPELTEFEMNLRRCIVEHLTTHIKDGNGSEMSSTVFIDDDTAKEIAEDVLELVKRL